MGKHTLDTILKEKKIIAEAVAQELQGPTDEWGIFVEMVEVRNVTIPANMQRAMVKF